LLESIAYLCTKIDDFRFSRFNDMIGARDRPKFGFGFDAETDL